MRYWLITLIIAFCMLSSFPSTLKAQSTASLLSGKVLNEKNLPIKEVSVQITYLPWNRTRMALTDKKGIFSVANLPPGGPYTIKFSCSGYEDQTREILSLELGNINSLSLHMRPEIRKNKESDVAGNPLVSADTNNTKGAD